ncbi:MAG: lmo0937 family membrane protein [Gemmatimonadaceae bacterium]
MDLGIFAAIAMLVVWALGTFLYDAPGWLHLLLSFGVFLLIWRIVVRGSTAQSGGRPGRD